MSNLSKTKKKVKSHALAGMGIGAATGLFLYGLSKDNSKDPKSILLPIAVGAAIGGVIGGSIKSASAEKKEPVEIKKRIEGKGVVFVHCADKSTTTPTYEDPVRLKLEYSNGFQYDIVKKAFEIAQKTKSIQNVFKLFEDKENALFFIETDFLKGGLNGETTCFLKDKNTFKEILISLQNQQRFEQNKINPYDTYFFTIEIRLYPNNTYTKIENNEMIKATQNEQIASLLVTIGHELFIHDKHLEAVKLWKNGKNTANYKPSFTKALEDVGAYGSLDHRNYILGKKTKMTQYLNELKNLAKINKLGIPYQVLINAINSHNKRYK